MIYIEIEKVIRNIVFKKEQLKEELTKAEAEIYEDWLEIKKKVEGQDMKQDNLVFEHNDHQITVSYAYGSDDGYYWDKIFFLIIDKKPYILLEIGSGSGWVENDCSLKQVSFDYLKERKKENDTKNYNHVTIRDFNEELFKRLFDFMIDNNANEVREGEYDCELGNYKLFVVEEEQ